MLSILPLPTSFFYIVFRKYYLLGQEHSEQGYNVSYVYCDSDMMYIARSQMELIKGELPAQANEVAVSEYFLSTYGLGAGIGEAVRFSAGQERIRSRRKKSWPLAIN